MYHIFCLEVTPAGYYCLSGIEPPDLSNNFAALLLYDRAAGTMDSSIDATSTHQTRVSRINDCIGLLS
jgi:hypothetical protein